MRIVSGARSLALVLATLAVASACKKNPTAPDESRKEPSGRLTDDGAAVQAMRGGQPACSQRSAVTLDGVDYSAIRRARVGLAVDVWGDPHIEVSNIGSSGLDGVCADYQEPAGRYVQSELGLDGIDGLRVHDTWMNQGGRFATAMAVGPMYPAAWEQEALVVVAPTLGCRAAHLALTLGGAVVRQGLVSCETAGPLEGAYLVGRLPAGFMTANGTPPDSFRLGRGFIGPRVFQLEAEFPGGPIAVSVPDGQTVLIGGFRLTVSVGGAAALQRTMVTAGSTASGGGTVLLRGD